MKSLPLRTLVLFGLTALALTGVAAWAWSLSASAASQAQSAAQSLSDSQRFARVIAAAGGPAGPMSADLIEVQLRQRIADAIDSADIESADTPPEVGTASVASGGSPSSELSILVRLQNVTLTELFGFCVALNEPGEGQSAAAVPQLPVTVRSVRLSAPREQVAGEQWVADVTVSCMVGKGSGSDRPVNRASTGTDVAESVSFR